jgi:hypothetical protein
MTNTTTPASFFATTRKAFVAAGAAFVATEGGLVPALVNDSVAAGSFQTGEALADLGIGIGAAAVAFAAVWRVVNTK